MVTPSPNGPKPGIRNLVYAILTRSFLVSFLAVPHALRSQDFIYNTYNGTTIITGCNGCSGTLAIPSVIDGLPVTGIGQDAFRRNSSLTDVVFPNSVTNIGDGAFANCSGLTNVSIPSSLTAISAHAFLDCTQLRSVALGNGLVSIGSRAFLGCSALANIVIPDSVKELGEEAWVFCPSLTNVSFGRGIAIIPSGAFGGCTNLANLTIPDGVRIIENDAFTSCTGLTNATLGNGVTTIGVSAFWNCNRLSQITLGSGVTNIQNSAFINCSELTALNFTGNCPTSVGPSILLGANQTIVYYLPGTSGWDFTFGERPTAPWVLPYPVILDASPGFGVHTNGFGFTISWATNATVSVEASTNLSAPSWSSIGTNTLVNGWSPFNDGTWSNSVSRFYRVRSL